MIRRRHPVNLYLSSKIGLMLNPEDHIDASEVSYQQSRILHWDAVARTRDSHPDMATWYHQRLVEIYRFHVDRNARILELGCADGRLLAALRSAHGVGVDFSEEMIRRARVQHPNLEFIHADVHDLSALEKSYDVIILSD